MTNIDKGVVILTLVVKFSQMLAGTLIGKYTIVFLGAGVAFWPFPISQSISLGQCSHLLGNIKVRFSRNFGEKC
jgi:hypothetical protein